MTVYERLLELCKKKNTTITALCLQATGNKGNLQTWKNNNGHMKSDYLLKCANILDCSTDYILGQTNLINVFPVKSKSRKIYKNINLKKLFNNDDTRCQYIYRLWEAQNEIFVVNSLLENMIMYHPFENSDWFVIFKYDILVLYGAAQLLLIDNKNQDNTFNQSINELLKNPDIKHKYDIFFDFFDTNKQFFRKSRNIVGHFEHYEDVDIFRDFLSEQSEYKLCLNNNFLTDNDNPIYINILIKLYKKLYRDNTTSDNDIIIKIVNLYSELMDILNQILSTILFDFYQDNGIFDASDCNMQKDESISEKIQQNVEIQTVQDNHGIIGHTHAPVTIIHSSESDKNSQNIETALFDIFEGLDIVKQAQLLAYAAELKRGNK